MAIQIGKPLALLRASLYTDPGDPAAIIADVYGDFTTGGVAGAVPAVLIDKTTFVYAAAGHAVGSITAVYVNEILASGYSTTLSNNYQSQGIIATIDFAAQPDGVVTWRGTGKLTVVSVLITNCIQQLANLLYVRAGFPITLANLPSWREAISLVDKYSYQTAWVVRDERDVIEWITEMLFNVMGRAYLRGDDTIVLHVDDGGLLPDFSALLDRLVASTDVVDGDSGVVIEGQYEHLVNALDIYYLWDWSRDGASSRIVTTGDEIRDARASRNAHGEARKIVTLRGVRRAEDVLNWSYVLYRRQSFANRLAGATVRFAVEGPKLAHATIGDFIGFSWEYGPMEPGNVPYRNRILQIIGMDSNPTQGGRTNISAIDTGQTFT